MTTKTTRGDARWRRWGRAWAWSSAPGVCLAVLMWGVSTVLPLLLLITLMGSCLSAVVRSDTENGPHAKLTSDDLSAGLNAALTTTFAGVTSAISVSAALLLLAVVALTSPPVAGRLLGRRDTHTPEAHEDVPTASPDPRIPLPRAPQATPTPPPLRSLTNAELCVAWRHSFMTLTKSHSIGEHVRVVELRQKYLDEMELRDAAALAAWLAAGARAAGGPDRFMNTHDPAPRPPDGT